MAVSRQKIWAYRPPPQQMEKIARFRRTDAVSHLRHVRRRPMTTVRVLLNTNDAARYLKSTPGTLKSWRYQGTGPLCERSGRRVLYDLAELDRWLAGERGRGESRAMTPPPPRPKLPTLEDVLPADVAEFIRETALLQRVTPAGLIREWATAELVRRIVSYQSEDWDGPGIPEEHGQREGRQG